MQSEETAASLHNEDMISTPTAPEVLVPDTSNSIDETMLGRN